MKSWPMGFFLVLFLLGFELGTSRVLAEWANPYTDEERAGRKKKLYPDFLGLIEITDQLKWGRNIV